MTWQYMHKADMLAQTLTIILKQDPTQGKAIEACQGWIHG